MMALATTCQTPGATYTTRVNGRLIVVEVALGRDLPLLAAEAATVERNIHNAIELVLARYFR